MIPVPSALCRTSRRLLSRCFSLLALTTGGFAATQWDKINEEGSFLNYRRQSLIGAETYSIVARDGLVIVKSKQSENERGRITGYEAELRLQPDLTPTFYENTFSTGTETLNKLKVVATPQGVSVSEAGSELQTKPAGAFFPVHSDIPAAMEMMLYHYYFAHGTQKPIKTYPRGQVSIEYRKQDTVVINGKNVVLDRYKVKGITWGFEVVWLDQSRNLIAIVKANTQFREVIKKGYEAGLPTFIAGNVEEQMNALNEYTSQAKGVRNDVIALVGGDVVDGLTDTAQKDMTVLVEGGRIKSITARKGTTVPAGAKVIDVTGKTLIPGLWDMHAHANQVQWAPAYLAGGVTTIRDNGNEVEFATAFRDAIAGKRALGPDIILAGMTDGEGILGNGIIRARTPEEARQVVAMYFQKGYRQIKIYTSLQPEIVKVLAEEAHKLGITVTGHVPRAVGNARNAVELGMDMLSHQGLFLSVLFPGVNFDVMRVKKLLQGEVTRAQIDDATAFFLKHKTVLDPTIALDIKGALPVGTTLESVIPDVGRQAYELWEGKRFQKGLSPEKAREARKHYERAMDIIGHFARAGVPVVAGTDNAVPVFSLYLEIESYSKLGRLTPLQALQSATIVPARAMGLADLENIDHIRSVSAVMTNGSYYESARLWPLADFLAKN
jgi:imidazolonepropionase-like amidohydrolase